MSKERHGRVTATETKILAACERLLTHLGYRKLALEDVAQEAGVGRRTIYLYFANKSDLIDAVLDRAAVRVRDELQRIGQASDQVEERLAAMLCARVGEWLHVLAVPPGSLATGGTSLDAAWHDARARAFDAETQLVAKIVAEGARGGAFVFDSPTEAARTMLLATESLLAHAGERNNAEIREAIEARAAHLSRLLIDGLKRREQLSY